MLAWAPYPRSPASDSRDGDRRELRRRGRWFVVYGLVSQLLYTEFKNVVARTAHLKELMGERKWKVTPRTAGAARGGDAGRRASDAPAAS